MLTSYNGEQPEEPEAEQPVQVSHEQTLLKFIKTKIEKKKRNNRVDAIVVLRQYFEKMNTGNDCNPLEYWRSNESDMPMSSQCGKESSVCSRNLDGVRADVLKGRTNYFGS
ncbi:uncharacterized protein LOC121405327 [Drosophila obscura]|uniref:uncharacterized protein LOC121405327 n=1 Tax=Drosophila obscura TaxID=7282 RepID=UPI001BB2289D|nr:uncharacterized protein LOC121405327 [Drosophila obscura]